MVNRYLRQVRSMATWIATTYKKIRFSTPNKVSAEDRRRRKQMSSRGRSLAYDFG
jgi:hypothetical protein